MPLKRPFQGRFANLTCIDEVHKKRKQREALELESLRCADERMDIDDAPVNEHFAQSRDAALNDMLKNARSIHHLDAFGQFEKKFVAKMLVSYGTPGCKSYFNSARLHAALALQNYMSSRFIPGLNYDVQVSIGKALLFEKLERHITAHRTALLPSLLVIQDLSRHIGVFAHVQELEPLHARLDFNSVMSAVEDDLVVSETDRELGLHLFPLEWCSVCRSWRNTFGLTFGRCLDPAQPDIVKQTCFHDPRNTLPHPFIIPSFYHVYFPSSTSLIIRKNLGHAGSWAPSFYEMILPDHIPLLNLHPNHPFLKDPLKDYWYFSHMRGL